MRETAYFGGGCFWCTEALLETVPGVVDVISGYAGGTVPNPSYTAVCTGLTGHAEVVEVTFDPEVISYQELVEIFFEIHNPTTRNRQGADIGPQYRSIILTTSAEQKNTAEKVKAAIDASEKFDKPVVTEIKPLITFYPAEEHHQDYFSKNPEKAYCRMVISPKLDTFRKKTPGVTPMKAGYSPTELQDQLTPEQYAICVRGDTEPPGSGEYTDLDAEGTYACVVCKTPLFVSGTKYHSGSGWPSFWQPIAEDSIELMIDTSHGMTRTEVRCHTCGAHLGHVFDDGPPPTGKRFCINSVALEFTPST